MKLNWMIKAINVETLGLIDNFVFSYFPWLLLLHCFLHVPAQFPIVKILELIGAS
jgi:hypothetical protein